MIQWKINYIDDNDYFNDVNQQIGSSKVEYQFRKLQEKSQLLSREILFCQQLMDSDIKKDSYVSFNRVNKGIMRKVFNQQNKTKNISLQQQIRNRRPPPISI